MRKRLIWIAVLCFSLFLLAGCGGSKDEGAKNPPPAAPEKAAPAPEKAAEPEKKTSDSGMSPEIAAIYEKAKQEGKVIWWSPDDDEVEPIKKAFEAKYPGITLEHFELKPSDAIQRIITEANAGQTNVDTFDLYMSDVPLLKERNLIMQVEWSKIFGVKPDQVYFDNSALSMWHISYPMVYNTSLVKPADVPKTWDDLLDPKWKGKIVVESRGLPFSMLAYSWGKEKTLDYVEKLMAQKPIVTKGGTPTNQAVINGQAAIAVGTYAYKTEQAKKEGAPVEWVKTAEVPAINHAAGVLKNAQHPNAAILLAHFVSTKEGLKARADGGGGGRLEGEGVDVTITGQEMQKNKVQLIIQDDKHLDLEKEVGEQVVKIINATSK